jgi:predicted naringenin-chalcone synthase
MPAFLRSIATALPEERLGRADWSAIADRITPPEVDRAVLARLADRSGIDERGCAAAGAGAAFYPDPGAASPPGTALRMALWSRTARVLALRAASEALSRAAIDPSRITHVITASCTGFESPGLDAHLIEELRLSRACRRLNVGFMGCHAAVNALSVAAAFVRADPAARVLVVCAEISSAHLHYGARLDRLIANTLFADGVAAAVVAADGPGDALRFVRSDSVLMEGSVAEMAWEVGDHGFEMTLGAAVPDLLRSGVGPWVRGILAEEAIDPMAVGGWAIHPGGPRVIDAVLESLALEPRHGESSRAILRDFGNMSSATLLFIMRAMRERGIPRPWVALAFGPGIAGEALLLA